MRRVFADFDCRHSKWNWVICRVATFDVLLSLTKYSLSCELTTCRPEIVDSSVSQPFIEIRAGYHPCLAGKLLYGQFIPNDTLVGYDDDHPSVLLLTGPNMGGKSTLMRQVSLLVIMAQMGSFVPATVCRLTPVDRIFTRLGANDRLTADQSTFLVELSETELVLSGATCHSLVLLDELGRGTATHDGAAIAYSVLKHIAHHIQCRTLFSTHYHGLVDDFRHDSLIRSGHMSCLVENENDDDPTEEVVTFLYKLVAGAAPRSYGFFAAKLAGVRVEVIRNAHSRSVQLERDVRNSKHRLFQLRQLAADPTVSLEQLTQLISAL